MEKIEAIIFDLGGVILDIDYNRTKKAFVKEGIIDFDEMYSQSSADQLFSNLETGKISEDNFYKEFKDCTRSDISNKHIKNAWNAMLLAFREESLSFLKSIKTKYRLFLLSNTNNIHYSLFEKIYREKEREHAFEDFFENAYYSFEIGMRKPGSDIYKFVLENNKLIPGNTLFIDDTLKNISPAKELGMQTILLETGMVIENLGL